MFQTFSILPIAFWLVAALLIGGVIWALGRLQDGSGLPLLTVLGTVAFWYVGDAYYNDYAENHAKLFERSVLQWAWFQVAWFLIVFLISAPLIHQWFNAGELRRRSGVVHMFAHGVNSPGFQHQIKVMFVGCFFIWTLLSLIAWLRLKGEIPYYFFPFLGYKAEPWGRGRIGAGFDALFTVAFYFQMIAATTFGVVMAVATNRRLRLLAVTFCLISWPYFIFDRTRNTMIAVVVPTILSWVFLRLRGSLTKRLLVLAGCFLLVNAWMAFVIANRSDMTMVQALKEKGFKLNSSERTHHEGLNMFEELCWVNTFIANGSYRPNWGSRYFAELVNPIPRVLWPGKPLIGIDYAMARGQTGGEAGQASVFATVSTGFIGQGVVNFGGVFGPAAAALLMSLWVAILARQDLHIAELGRLPLYSCGLILTFNLGRDITLLTLYPFAFGALALWWINRHSRRNSKQAPVNRVASIPSRRTAHSPKAAINKVPGRFSVRRAWSPGSARVFHQPPHENP